MGKCNIFGNTLIATDKIKKITVKPTFNKHVEFCLTVRVNLSKGGGVDTWIKVVKQKDIKKKFGTYDETAWYGKGLNYDKARRVMEEDNDYNDILSAIRKALKDDAILDAHEGDVFDYLDMTGILDKYKEQYLSLIRESTDEEFKKIETEHYYYEKLRELRYSRDEEEQNKIYEELKPLHETCFGHPINSLPEVLRWIEDAIYNGQLLSRYV